MVAAVLPLISGTTAATTVATTVEPDTKNVHPEWTQRWRVAAEVLPHICTSGTTVLLQRYYRLKRICGTTAQVTVLPCPQKKLGKEGDEGAKMSVRDDSTLAFPMRTSP